MNQKNQKQVWNNIAKEWYKFKEKPAEGVIKFLKKQKGDILDLGGGAGRHLVRITNGKMYLVDFSKKMIKFAKKRAKAKGLYENTKFFVSNVTKLPFKDNFFDAAICIAIFHCLSPRMQKKAVKELFRVLKGKAKAKIVVWNKNSKRFKNAGKEKNVGWRDKGKRYYYLFDEKEIHGLFREAGFKIIKKEKPQRNITFVVEKPSKSTSS